MKRERRRWRFALLPHICGSCNCYFWLEPYKKTYLVDDDKSKCPISEPTCSSCLSRYKR